VSRRRLGEVVGIDQVPIERGEARHRCPERACHHRTERAADFTLSRGRPERPREARAQGWDALFDMIAKVVRVAQSFAPKLAQVLGQTATGLFGIGEVA
jgi:hypothetical protein